MRNVLALLALVVLAVAGLGYHLNWYQVKTDPAPGGHRTVNIDINSVKIVEDVHKGVEKGEEKLQRVLDQEKEQVRPEDAARLIPAGTPAPPSAFPYVVPEKGTTPANVFPQGRVPDNLPLTPSNLTPERVHGGIE